MHLCISRHTEDLCVAAFTYMKKLFLESSLCYYQSELKQLIYIICSAV